MLRQLRALFSMDSPLPPHIHYHLDDHGHRVLCDESRCRPVKLDPHVPLYLLQR